MQIKPLVILLLIIMVVVAACGGDDADDEQTTTDGDTSTISTDGATEVVEAFWEARINADEDGLFETICADEEVNLETYSRSFASVTNVRIEDMACTVSEPDGDSAIVTCDGQIMADYGAGEDTEFPFGSYTVVRESGDWKWCGETAAPEASG